MGLAKHVNTVIALVNYSSLRPLRVTWLAVMLKTGLVGVLAFAIAMFLKLAGLSWKEMSYDVISHQIHFISGRKETGNPNLIVEFER
jgi:hypothetical protein